jgi:hypothetical protein
MWSGSPDPLSGIIFKASLHDAADLERLSLRYPGVREPSNHDRGEGSILSV